MFSYPQFIMMVSQLIEKENHPQRAVAVLQAAKAVGKFLWTSNFYKNRGAMSMRPAKPVFRFLNVSLSERRRRGLLISKLNLNTGSCRPLLLSFHSGRTTMEIGRRQGGDYAQYAEEQRQREREQAYEDSLAEDLGEDFFLPISHRPTENLNTDNLEQASIDTQLTSTSIGFQLLQKMGWKGKGLGKDEQGITEPIKAGTRDPKLGLGKQEQDDFYTAEENVQRKKLDVEQETTEELAKKREVEAEREQKIQTEVKEIRKVFYCELCNKQYKLAMEFETHLSSYDHNHKKRFKEMKEQQSSRTRDERQKKEQLREEKEMAKFAQHSI
ncbi:hypothetical protein R1sor_002509 [Riccia sorocarpa]|uniref:G-patch domain-containing protein n=1 Tax=Riccia sorocarpa TaxID=122646 RepID=A0ABD3H259_9MARC